MYDSIEKETEKLIPHAYSKCGCIDIIRIAKQKDFYVCCAIMKDDTIGFILVNKKEKNIFGLHSARIIGVSANMNIKWKRFFVAYEFAEYMLHQKKLKRNGVYAHKNSKNEIDKWAEYYAMCLLMPRYVMDLYAEDVKDLSFYAKVCFFSEVLMVPKEIVWKRIMEIEKAC